jgi:hypothetical protein
MLTISIPAVAGYLFLQNSALQLVGLLFFPAAMCVYVRLSIAVPAAAAGGDSRFMTAWQQTRGNTIKLLAIRFLVLAISLILILMMAVILQPIIALSPYLANIVVMWATLMILLVWFQVVETVLYAQFNPAVAQVVAA